MPSGWARTSQEKQALAPAGWPPSPRELSVPGGVPAPQPGTAGLEGKSQHGGHLAARGGLGDEDGGGEEEDEEGQARAAHGDAVAHQEADVLLDEGHHQQRQHRTHVDAPVKPVEEAAAGVAAEVHHLTGRGEREGQGGSGAPCHGICSAPAARPTETLLGSLGGHSGTFPVHDLYLDTP